MRLMHGTDSPWHDSVWIWSNRIVELVCYVVPLGFAIYCFMHMSALALALIIVYWIASRVFVYAVWRNRKYSVSEDGVSLLSGKRRSSISWSEIRRYGVFPIRVFVGVERKYVVVFLSDGMPQFPIGLYSSKKRNDMILIRSTEEHLAEIEAQMAAHAIPYAN